MWKSIGRKLRRVNTRRFNAAEKLGRDLGIDVSEEDLEAHLLCRGEPEAVLRAMAMARTRGLPDNWGGLCEAQLADLDLTLFVERGYTDPELKTLSARRKAAKTDAAAAGALARELAANLRKVTELRRRGPQGLGERISWSVLEGCHRSAEKMLQEELAELAPRLRPIDAEAVAAELAGAV